MSTGRALSIVLAALALVLPACSRENGTIQSEVPPREGFSPVADVLSIHCGSLDCHGDSGRNLQIYGRYGMRLDTNTLPDPDPTTDPERDATYQAVIALEPEVLANVYADGGADPERLTLVRKARGIENHVGKAPFHGRADADRCLISWLKGRVDDAACDSGTMLNRQ